TPELYTLSLHDALPILAPLGHVAVSGLARRASARALAFVLRLLALAHRDPLGHGLAARSHEVDVVLEPARVEMPAHADQRPAGRSEEHTSELQSLAYLV